MNLKINWRTLKDKFRVYAPFFVLSLSLIGLYYNSDPEAIIVSVVAGVIFLFIGSYISKGKKGETHGLIHYVVTCIFIFSTLLISVFPKSLDSEFIGYFIWLPAFCILILSSIFSLRYHLKIRAVAVEKKTFSVGNKFFKIIIFTLILSIGLSLLALLPQIFHEEITNVPFLSKIGWTTSTSKYILTSLLFGQVLLLILLIGIILLRSIIKYLGIATRYAGSTIPIRIVSLGITVLIFPQQVISVFKAPFNFFTSITYSFLRQLDKITHSPELIHSPKWFTEIIISTPRNALGILDDIWRYFQQFLYDLTIVKLILAIACWIIFGQIIDFIVGKAPEHSGSNGRLSQFFKSISPSSRQNVLLIIVFLISGYLSIAAMVAIPWMAQGNVPKEIVEARVKELRDLKGTQKEFEERFPDFDNANPLDAIKKENLPSHTFENSDLKNRWLKIVDDAKKDYNDYKQRRADTIKRWKSFRQKAWERILDLEESAINSYKSQNKLMGVPEQQYYFRETFNWHIWNVSEINDVVKEVRSKLIRNDEILRDYSKDYKEYVAQMRDYLIDSESRGLMPYKPFEKLPPIMSDNLKFIQFELPEYRYTPAPPKPGSQWGVFGMVSGWLLKTRSPSLILITGMLGFGLFGSVISSFIRQQTSHIKGDPLVPDLSFAVVRGLSAAVVVFLAVEGGLAIFTTAELKPNPYVLFFTCLVGAVFSETVWNWARKKLSEKFSE